MLVNIYVVGCGGTGGNLIARLARFLSSYQNDNVELSLSIIDGDTVEVKNIGRQPFDLEDVGSNKAVSLASNIESCLGVTISAFGEYLENTYRLNQIVGSKHEGMIDGYQTYSASDVDILVSCVDNHAARKVMHDWFENNNSYGEIFFIDSANEEVSGEVVFARASGNRVVAPDRFFYYPEISKDIGKSVTEMSCEELNNVNPQHYATNCFAADICFSYIANLLSNIENAQYMKGGITYFHALNMFSRFDAYYYNEEAGTYVRE